MLVAVCLARRSASQAFQMPSLLQDMRGIHVCSFLVCAVLGYFVGWSFDNYLQGAPYYDWLISNVAERENNCKYQPLEIRRPLCEESGKAVLISFVMALVSTALFFWAYLLVVYFHKVPEETLPKIEQNSSNRQNSSTGNTYSSLLQVIQDTETPNFMSSQLASLVQKEREMKHEIKLYSAWASFWQLFGRGVGLLNICLPSLSVSILALIKPDNGSASDNLGKPLVNTTSLAADVKENMKIREIRNVLICIFSVATVVTTAITKAITPDERYGHHNAKLMEVKQKMDTFKDKINSAGSTTLTPDGANGS